eukprot:5483656-Pleurochrysis_carterae.AAC.1
MSSHPTPREASVRRRHQLIFSPPPRFNLDSILPPRVMNSPATPNLRLPRQTPKKSPPHLRGRALAP